MNDLTTFRQLRILAVVTLLFSTFLISLTWHQSFRLDTDYDSNFPIYDSLFAIVGTTHRFPAQNSLTGLSTLGDPLSAIWNPIFFMPVMMFGTEYGFRITIGLVIMLSSITMWLLLRYLRISPLVRIWSSLLYATAGTLVARISAGHIEKILSYPLVPIFFLALLQKRGILAGFMAAMAFLSGDVYLAWFFLIFLVATFVFQLWKKELGVPEAIREMGKSSVMFLFFSSPKLIPFLAAVQPNMERFFPIHYTEGSIHAFFSPLAFIIPWQSAFYDRPLLQRLLGFHFNWYEYFAFVSPLPLLFLVQKRIWRNRIVRLLLVLMVVGVLYTSLAYPYSPFYWLFRMLPALQSFRVPQRIFFPMTTIVIVLVAMAADGWFLQHKKRMWQRLGVMIMAGSLLWTTVIFIKTFARSFESPRVAEASVATELRERDSSLFSVASFVCCMQTFLIRERIGIVNYYYGWRLRFTPNFIKTDGNGFDYSELATVQPKYIIGKSSDDFTVYGYKEFFIKDSIRVWKRSKTI